MPHAPILGIVEALSQPQAVARDLVVEVEHPVLGRIPIVNRPIRVPGDPQPLPRAPPPLGQQSAAILQDVLGLSTEQVAALLAAKVIG